MKAKLIVEGREFPIEIQDPELQKLLKPPKKTGYERVEYNKFYYNVSCDDEIDDSKEEDLSLDDDLYNIANYYSDRTVAENNARADKLMRQLRRFAVENGGTPSIADWQNGEVKDKFTIYYNYNVNRIEVGRSEIQRYLGDIYFHSRLQAEKSIAEFEDELTWYFTEYKDSL